MSHKISPDPSLPKRGVREELISSVLSAKYLYCFVIPSESRNLIVRLLQNFVLRNDSVKKFYRQAFKYIYKMSEETFFRKRYQS